MYIYVRIYTVFMNRIYLFLYLHRIHGTHGILIMLYNIIRPYVYHCIYLFKYMYRYFKMIYIYTIYIHISTYYISYHIPQNQKTRAHTHTHKHHGKSTYFPLTYPPPQEIAGLMIRASLTIGFPFVRPRY